MIPIFNHQSSILIPFAMRIALISDIHGNRPALEAVLADIKKAAVDQIICLGDIANVGPHPSQCLDIVRDLDCPVLQGNHELYLLGQFENDEWRTAPLWASMRWARRQLRPDQFEYIRQLPFQHEIAGNGRCPATFVHGSPLSQYRGFMPQQDDEAIAARMNGLDNTTLFCGHTHLPLYRPWSNSWLVNIGSVGMPLDGSPAAKYVIATRQGQDWRVEFRRIAYNTKQLMADFDAVGLQEIGGKVTAVFRQQMLTGEPLAPRYFHALHQRAKAEGISATEAYDLTAVPPQAQHWLRNEREAK